MERRFASTVTGVMVALSAAACGGSSPSVTQPPAPVPGVLQVAGQYRITQRELSSDCGGGGQPASVTSTVTHAPGAATFTMRDTGGTTFEGTVASDGEFSANGTFGPDSTGQTFTQRLQGRFSATGFDAMLSVHATPRNCDFTRAWTATKEGSPNVIP